VNPHEGSAARACKIEVPAGAEGMLMVGLSAIDLLAAVMTVLTSVDTLSGEIASGTIQAVAAKPIGRWELMLGKWLGFTAMLAALALAVRHFNRRDL
jgi:ABC-type transport system involved in multi-copper enzyme maturation permease subunit